MRRPTAVCVWHCCNDVVATPPLVRAMRSTWYACPGTEIAAGPLDGPRHKMLTCVHPLAGYVMASTVVEVAVAAVGCVPPPTARSYFCGLSMLCIVLLALPYILPVSCVYVTSSELFTPPPFSS